MLKYHRAYIKVQELGKVSVLFFDYINVIYIYIIYT